MLVLVRPCYPDYLGNKLFVPHHTPTGHWLIPFVQVRQVLEQRGIAMETWDMHPLSEADVILSQDLPLRRDEIAAARQQAPRAKFVLQILETPLDRQHHHDPANHDLFDAILTYHRRLCDERRYFHYHIPMSPPPQLPPPLPFAQRKPLVMINSNRRSGLLRMRQSGLAGLPGVGPMFSGWHVPFAKILAQTRGQLYGRRRRLARTAERIAPQSFDIFGNGWQGEQIGWYHELIPHRPYACARGTLPGSKFDCLAKYRFSVTFENMTSNVGYISEKIFDSLFTGAVPIYLGEESIADEVPPDCFVDARRFRSDRELLEFAVNCTQDQWEALHAAGQAFLKSPAFQQFLAPAMTERMLAVFRHVTQTAPDHAAAP